jgi:hypothetical protein
VQIASVVLLDGETGGTLETLSAYTPLVWNNGQYVAWDQTVPASSQLRVNYTIAPPSYSALGSSFTYSHPFALELTILVDGGSLTLESPPMTRPAPLAT